MKVKNIRKVLDRLEQKDGMFRCFELYNDYSGAIYLSGGKEEFSFSNKKELKEIIKNILDEDTSTNDETGMDIRFSISKKSGKNISQDEMDKFADKFIELVESNDMECGGGIGYVKSDKK